MDFETREIRKMEMKSRQEKPEKKKRKSSRVACFFILLLLFLNLGLMTYIAYDKKIIEGVMKHFEEKKDASVEIKEEKLSLNDEVVRTLYSYLAPVKEKLVMRSEYYAKDFLEDEKKAIAMSLLKEEDFKQEEDSYQLKAFYLDDAISKILGEDAFIEKEDMKDFYYQKYSKNLEGNIRLSYNSLLDSYSVTLEKREDVELEPFFTKLFSAVKKKDQIILTEKVIYTLKSDQSIGIYSDWQLSKLLEEVALDGPDIYMDSYLSKAGEIVYTFQKKGDHYQFISSKVKEKS